MMSDGDSAIELATDLARKAHRNAELDSIQAETSENPAYALARINHYILNHPPSARALVIRAHFLVGFRQFDLVARDLTLAERLCAGPHSHIQELRGDAYACQGRWGLAEHWYRKGLQLDPKDGELEAVLIDCLLPQGKFAQAEQRLTRLWRQRDAYTAYQFGQLYRYQEKNRRSARWFQKALALEPDFHRAKKALGDVETALKVPSTKPYDLQDTVGPSTKLAAGRCWRPKHPHAVMLRAIALAGFGRVAEAKKLIPELRRKFHKHSPEVEAAIYKAADRNDLSAKRRLQAASQEITTDWIMAGSCLARLGRYQQAEQCHRRALECDDGDFDEAWLNIGLLMRAQFRLSEARHCFVQSLMLDPNCRDAQDALRDITLALTIADLPQYS